MAGLVQETSGYATGSTLTLTFPAPVTSGNAVIIALCGYYGGSVSGFTVGAASVTFAKVATSGGYNAEIWAAYRVTAPGAATVTVTTDAAGIIAWAYEVAGVVTLDTSAGTYGDGTSWSSGTTARTIPYQHFVVGLGAVISNTKSITATSSGWTNETAYSDVASGSVSVSGVSGCQQPTSSGTYTYEGTAAQSSGWAAVTAAFLAAAPPGQVLPDWGGYVFDEHGSYTAITATFTIPPCTGGGYNSVWVGMGGVYQVGIFQTYATSYPGNSWTRPWTWWLPGAGEQWNQDAFPTAAGDSLTLMVEVTSEDWLMTIANATKGWAYTEVKSVLAVNIGSIHNDGAGPVAWPFPLATAEVIIEKQDTGLADYGSVDFTQVATTPAATKAPYPVFTASTPIDQYPGAFDPADGSFAMHRNAGS
jgi:hypothetical protein